MKNSSKINFSLFKKAPGVTAVGVPPLVSVSPGDSVDPPRVSRVSHLGAAFAILLVIDLGAGWLAVDVVDSTRAYSVGAAFYAKSQKIAVLKLNRFVASRDPQDFELFLQGLSVPTGDHDARIAMQADRFDRAATIEGLLRGQNPAADVGKIIRYFRALKWWAPFKTAVADWSAADDQVEALSRLAYQIKADTASGPATQAAQLAEIRAIDDRLTAQEDRFLGSMNVAAQSARRAVMGTLVVSTVLLWLFGMLLAARLFYRQAALDRQLRSSEKRFRDYAGVASDWFWEVDAGGKVASLSDLFFTLTGIAPDRIVGRDATVFLREFAADAESKNLVAAFAARETVRGLRLRYTRPDGTAVYFSVSAKPYFDTAGQFAGFRGVGSDITANIEAAQNLRAEKERAEIANRAKSEFLANMSHELRTPLNAIIGFSEIMMNRVFGNSPPEQYESYAADINNSGQHLLSLINEILDLSRIEAGQQELRESDIGLDKLIESSRNLFGARFQLARLTFTVDLPVPAPMLHIDAGKLKQCLANLLSNALKFTEAGGTVRVFADFDAGGDLAIAVEDSGIGIAAPDIPKVLAPFGQVASAFQRRHTGTGLGLTITKSLIEQHGGSLTIDSKPGAGTTVTLTLPSSRIVANAIGAQLAAGKPA